MPTPVAEKKIYRLIRPAQVKVRHAASLCHMPDTPSAEINTYHGLPPFLMQYVCACWLISASVDTRLLCSHCSNSARLK